MSPVNVLHLMNGFGDASIGRIVQRLVAYLGSERYRWWISGLCGMGGMDEVYRQMGVEVIDFSAQSGPSRPVHQEIADFLKHHEIDILHTHTIHTTLEASRALWLARRGQGGRSSAGRTMHLTTKHVLTHPAERRYGLVYALVDRLSLYMPDHLVAVSDAMRRQVCSQPGIAPRRVSTIRNAIDCQYYDQRGLRGECRQEWPLAPDCLVVGFNGRLVTSKRLNLLLEGFAHARRQVGLAAHLVIAGEGELRGPLEEHAARLGITGAVTFAGFRRDIPRLLAGLDIYIQPSMNEGLSLGLLEAMAAGKAVIATRVGGTAEVVTDHETGLLIAPDSAAAMAGALETLFTQPLLRARLADAGRRRVHAAFDFGPMMEAYGQLYQDLVKRQAIRQAAHPGLSLGKEGQ